MKAEMNTICNHDGGEQMDFRTIAKTAKSEGLPECMLRDMLKRGELPGFYQRTRFYVNVDALREQLETRSKVATTTRGEE